MEVIVIDGEKFYYIDKYEYKFGYFYKFSNLVKSIYCYKEKDNFIEIKNKKYLREINKRTKNYKIEDVV